MGIPILDGLQCREGENEVPERTQANKKDLFAIKIAVIIAHWISTTISFSSIPQK